MWHLEKIPRILHVYWGGEKLPYVRYLTLASFRYYNPEWRIILHKPLILQKNITWTTHEQKYDYNYVDYYHGIGSLFIEVWETDFGELGFSNLASEVHKSDFLRWKLLHEIGGLWADMDIIFTKSMDDIYFNVPEKSRVNVAYCISEYGHSIGFLMGGEGNDYFKTIYEASRKEYTKEKYQCIGSLLCNKLFPTEQSTYRGNITPHNVSMEVVYAYDANHVKELFGKDAPNRFTDKSIGIHWYAGHELAGIFLNESDGGFNLKRTSIVDNAIRDFNFKKSRSPFHAIYTNNFWGSAESISGKGSELQSTMTIREQLPALVEKYGIKRVLDVGCGDFNWMKEVSNSLEYYMGLDIVEEIIENNVKKYQRPNKIEFLSGDVKDFGFFEYHFDLIILADVLVHFSFYDIFKTLNRIAESNIRYALMTHFTEHQEHIDIETGSWRHLNMTIEPLNLPAPLESLPYNEKYVYTDGVTEKQDKTLSLWTNPLMRTWKM